MKGQKRLGKFVERICGVLILSLLIIDAAIGRAQTEVEFDRYFRDATLRIDYMRVGCYRQDTIVSKRVAIQNRGIWAGSKRQLIDKSNSGEYRVVVEDVRSGKEIYSRTYTTLFHEYRETEQGRDSVGEFEEVVLLPVPREAVWVRMQKRDAEQRFYTAASIYVDPRDEWEVLPERVKPKRLHYRGDSHRKIDVVIVAEGYGKGDEKKMERDFKKFTKYLLAEEPFKSREKDFNVWGVGWVGEESGVSDPTKGREVASAVGSSYNTFGSARYLMTTRLFQLHDLLAGCSYDHIVIMANCDTYGGGAIYNFYAFSAVQTMSRWILPHELGHSIGGLADEYVDEELSYNNIHSTKQEPIEPNITTLVDFESKWADMMPEGERRPTEAVEGLGLRDCGPVGLYEGAGYSKRGIYRPCTNCMMNYYAHFCPVCMRAMNQKFDMYTH